MILYIYLFIYLFKQLTF